MRAFKLLIVGAFVLTVSSVQAQRDMILTQAGEELRCRIIDETPVRFVFAYLKNGKPFRSEIFKTLVTSFKFNYYDADLPNADKLPEAMYRATGSSDSESPRALSSKDNSSKKVKRKKRRSKTEESTEDSENTVEDTATPVVRNKETRNLRDEEEDVAVATKRNDSAVVTRNNPDSQSQPNRVIDRSTKPTTTTQQAEKKSNSVANNNANRIDRVSSSNSNSQKPVDKVVDKSAAATVENQEGNLEIEKVQDVAKEEVSVAENTPDAPVDISETELPNITINQKNKFRIGIKGGIGNRLDNNLQTTNSFDLYQEQLLRGFTLGADIAYFPNDVFGFGAIFTDFRSRNSDNEILYRNEFTGAEQIGSISNNRSVKFVGPALFFRKKLDYKTYVVLGLSPGYNFYNDKGSYDGVDYTFKGAGFGAASTLGIDFLLGNDVIGRDIILSFEAGYNYGKINALDYGDTRGMVDLPTSIDLSRLDFTIGLRFIRFPKYFRLTSY